MKISGITIENVRNHLGTSIDLDFGLNVFYGLNGAGKTSILEAVSICGFSKSFLPVLDSSLINTGNNSYSVMAKAVSDNDIPYKISVTYEKSKRKRISSTIGDNLLAKDIIGEMPMVILSPDYKSITFGSPEHRRSFVDRLLSQASKIYIEDLMNYKRALKQRNSLLSDFASGRKFELSHLKPWTELLIKTGSDIMLKRLAFLDEF
ncbi:MAG: AAA family ATPase, partial [bacterium]